MTKLIGFLGALLLLGGCTGGNGNPDPDCVGAECDPACEGADCTDPDPTGVDATIKAYLPANGTEIQVNGVAGWIVSDCDDAVCVFAVDQYDLYRVLPVCPNHAYLEKVIDVNDDGTFEVKWGEGEGGLNPTGEYRGDDGEDYSLSVVDTGTHLGLNGLPIGGIPITGDTFEYIVESTGGGIRGTISEDLVTAYFETFNGDGDIGESATLTRK